VRQTPVANEPLPVLSNAQLAEHMKALTAPATLVPVGKSRGGREIAAVRISNVEPAPAGKPAILIVANIDGNQVWTSALAMFEAQELARRATEAPVKSLLDSCIVYVIPCANPDAAEHRFATPRSEDNATGPGVDNDRDGRQGEDPASDVDGDGQILQIRVEDPRGEWIPDPLDARALVKADKNKGEIGKYRVWTEGRDLDHDERIAEDGPLDACVNDNFANDWKDHSPAAGVFPTDEPETRAFADFLLLHPEIALVVTYGELDNLVDKPKSIGADAPRQQLIPQPGVIEPDANLLAEIGKRYAEITANKTKGRGDDAGSFQTWAYVQRGLWSIAIDVWDISLEAPEKKDAEKKDAEKAGDEKKAEEKKADDKKVDEKKEGDKPAADSKDEKAKDDKSKDDKKDKRELGDDGKRLRWLDANGEIARFVAWHEFQHPELGKVEIGGFAPFARSEPPAAQSREIATKQLDFVLALGPELAHVEISELKAKELGKGVWELKAAVTNRARLPLMSASAKRTDTVRPARVDLVLGSDDALLGGDKMQLVRDLGGSGARVEMRWLVRGNDPTHFKLKVTTQHAGCVERSAEVKQ
jgi:hypothetical protein